LAAGITFPEKEKRGDGPCFLVLKPATKGEKKKKEIASLNSSKGKKRKRGGEKNPFYSPLFLRGEGERVSHLTIGRGKKEGEKVGPFSLAP